MGPADSYRNMGTTITVRDLFINCPVRKKNLTAAAELERVKQRVERIALIHPHIAFSLYDSAKAVKVLNTRRVGLSAIVLSWTDNCCVSCARFTRVSFNYSDRIKRKG